MIIFDTALSRLHRIQYFKEWMPPHSIGKNVLKTHYDWTTQCSATENEVSNLKQSKERKERKETAK